MGIVTYAVPAAAFIGVLLFFMGLAGFFTPSASSVEERMRAYAGAADAPRKKKKEKKEKKRREIDPFATLSADVEDKRFEARVQRSLARADVKLRVSEYYYIRSGLAFGMFVVIGLFRGFLPMGVVAGIIGYFLPRIWVSRRTAARLKAFNRQLPDTISLLSNSLRAGSSFLQSSELVSRESQPPISIEFGRVVREVNLGLAMEEALANMVRRIRSDDLDLMVTAINIQQQVGGNLAEILDTIAFTIRERVKIKGDINTLTAQGRYSGYLVAFLPIGIMLALQMINPEFMQPLFNETIGRILLGVGGVMMAIGFFMIRKITDIQV
ncbi:MAG TPA: type II secretion system F family protein [Candidatus Dormibacteraeota bacterium]|nr:type II secretion system F family protein [Candidatus Dormibacteraeota bacterium]